MAPSPPSPFGRIDTREDYRTAISGREPHEAISQPNRVALTPVTSGSATIVYGSRVYQHQLCRKAKILQSLNRSSEC